MKRILQRGVGLFLVASLATFCVWDLVLSTDVRFIVRNISGLPLDVVDGLASAEDANTSESRLVQQGRISSGRESYSFSGRSHQRTHYQTLRAFKESIGETWKSTVQILVRNRQVALGAIVHPDGWIVSKSSEVPDQFEVKLADGTKAIGTVKSRKQDMDLVLIKVERSGLKPVDLRTNQEIPVGGWLVSTDTRPTPLTIGVLSVSNRNLRQEKAVLGVILDEAPKDASGAAIERLIVGGAADRAGLEVGDVIQEIDGKAYFTRQEVLDTLRSLNAGQTISLGIVREGRQVKISAQMMDLPNALWDSTEMEVNGQISARATGFQNVMQHDTVLLPHQCGGPIVDVEGNVVGLNIARGGRVSSYAYHAKNLEPAIRDMMTRVGGPALANSRDTGVVSASAVGNPASSQSTVLPASVPTSIQIESLKPEVVLPSPM
jgi:serine protease Do